MTVTAIPPSASGSAESLTTPTTTVVETPMSTTDSRPASMKASVATVLSNPLLSATPETKLSEVPIPSDTSEVTSTEGFSDAWQDNLRFRRSKFQFGQKRKPASQKLRREEPVASETESETSMFVRETQMAYKREKNEVKQESDKLTDRSIVATTVNGAIETVAEAQIPEEDSEESAHEEMWHENVQKDSPPPAKYTNVPIAVHRPAVHRDDVPRSTKVPPVRQNITKNPRGTASEAQLQRLVDEIAKLKEEILRRQRDSIALLSATPPAASTPQPQPPPPAPSPPPSPAGVGFQGYALREPPVQPVAPLPAYNINDQPPIQAVVEVKGQMKAAEVNREIIAQIAKQQTELQMKVEKVAQKTIKREKPRSHDERHWDEFNETKTLARLPTAKVLRGPPDGEDVESSEILIPDSLTDFTQVDDEAERRRNARAPLSDYANDPDHPTRDPKGSAAQGIMVLQHTKGNAQVHLLSAIRLRASVDSSLLKAQDLPTDFKPPGRLRWYRAVSSKTQNARFVDRLGVLKTGG
ncbi:uncharacterized protein LOC111248128 [Varroa destructor]|uniref:Uncharacterized protein n=1 Tax=Varroa destructor TaxID=109461 RepID=A0A7M7K0P9_VARDE|nr:uncharacterized protein LOC111248128 [Varroa destructor]